MLYRYLSKKMTFPSDAAATSEESFGSSSLSLSLSSEASEDLWGKLANATTDDPVFGMSRNDARGSFENAAVFSEDPFEKYVRKTPCSSFENAREASSTTADASSCENSFEEYVRPSPLTKNLQFISPIRKPFSSDQLYNREDQSDVVNEVEQLPNLESSASLERKRFLAGDITIQKFVTGNEYWDDFTTAHPISNQNKDSGQLPFAFYADPKTDIESVGNEVEIETKLPKQPEKASRMEERVNKFWQENFLEMRNAQRAKRTEMDREYEDTDLEANDRWMDNDHRERGKVKNSSLNDSEEAGEDNTVHVSTRCLTGAEENNRNSLITDVRGEKCHDIWKPNKNDFSSISSQKTSEDHCRDDLYNNEDAFIVQKYLMTSFTKYDYLLQDYPDAQHGFPCFCYYSCKGKIAPMYKKDNRILLWKSSNNFLDRNIFIERKTSYIFPKGTSKQ